MLITGAAAGDDKNRKDLAAAYANQVVSLNYFYRQERQREIYTYKLLRPWLRRVLHSI